MTEETKNEATDINVVSKCECMLLGELMYMYFNPPEVVKSLVSNKMFYAGESEEGDKEYFTSILLAGFNQYATHVLFDPNNLLDIKIASIMPNDDYTGDTVVVRQLTEEQATMVTGMVGLDILADFITEFNKSESESN